jgi:hypothetical protein
MNCCINCILTASMLVHSLISSSGNIRICFVHRIKAYDDGVSVLRPVWSIQRRLNLMYEVHIKTCLTNFSSVQYINYYK